MVIVVEKFGDSADKMDREGVRSCVADDVERVEWLDGNPNSGVPVRGKEAFVQNMERPADEIMKSETTRMTEENNVVVAESLVRLTKRMVVPWPQSRRSTSSSSRRAG